MVAQALKSKTVWLGIIVAVLSVLQGFIYKLPLTAVEQAAVGCVVGVAIVYLRFLTTQPIEEK
jgi:uncharacterized membrane protein YccC